MFFFPVYPDNGAFPIKAGYPCNALMRVRFQSIIFSMNARLTVVATTKWRPSVIFLASIAFIKTWLEAGRRPH